MSNRKLKKLLGLWCKHDLISQQQSDTILDFMKERQRKNFFKLLKWLSIIGAFWFLFGLIATVINIFQTDFFIKIIERLSVIFYNIGDFLNVYIFTPIHNIVIHPICTFVEKIFGKNRFHFYYGTLSLIAASLLLIADGKIKGSDKIEKLNLSDEQKNILKTNWIINTISCIFFATAFMLFNMMLIPEKKLYFDEKIIPIWYIIGTISFFSLGYKFQKNIYIVFGIMFLGLSVGMFSGYDFACYWISASRPVIQIFVGIILLLIGYISQLKCELTEKEDKDKNTYLLEKFAGTYNWAGLLFVFIALWITSIWGFDFNLKHSLSCTIELWFANILFILASVGVMLYGAKTEQKIFFNYGLVFLIIETYTVFCARLMAHLSVGLSALLFGGLLVGTAKILQKLYLKNKINEMLDNKKKKYNQ